MCLVGLVVVPIRLHQLLGRRIKAALFVKDRENVILVKIRNMVAVRISYGLLLDRISKDVKKV